MALETKVANKDVKWSEINFFKKCQENPEWKAYKWTSNATKKIFTCQIDVFFLRSHTGFYSSIALNLTVLMIRNTFILFLSHKTTVITVETSFPVTWNYKRCC